MKEIKLRYNHDHGGSSLKWRVLIDGEESKFERVEFHVKTWTTEDILPNGEIKHHITAIANYVKVEGNTLIIN